MTAATKDSPETPPGETKSLISLSGITKDYGQHRALDNITLGIGSGVTGLLGPNGAGKSTLIKVLLGLVRTTSGTGTVLGWDIRDHAAEIRSAVGFMPEDDCYMHGLPGVDCVQVSGRLSRLPSLEGLRRAHEILDFCGIGQERYRNVETYSTGMRQKLRFAMAIVHDPSLLILDEPTTGLDPDERAAMLNRIRVLARQFGKTVLLCTHILPDVQVVCDHAVIISRGRVVTDAPLSELRRSPKPALTVQVTGDTENFLHRLQEHGLEAELTLNGGVVVSGDIDAISGRICTAAAESRVGLRQMTPAESSLEEVFLRAVRSH